MSKTWFKKYVCAAYDLHNWVCTKEVSRLHFRLCIKSINNNLRTFPRIKEALQLHILSLTYAAGMLWGVKIQPRYPVAPGDLGWKYSKEKKLAVDLCQTYDIDLTEHRNCSRCRFAKKEVSCLPFCSSACIGTRESMDVFS